MISFGAAVIQAVHVLGKPPAYTIAEVEVTDPATYQKYLEASTLAFQWPAGGSSSEVGDVRRQRGAAKADCRHSMREPGKGSAYFGSETYKALPATIENTSANDPSVGPLQQLAGAVS